MHSPEEIIRSSYRAILGRDPDPGGFAHYVQALREGAPLEALLSTFLNGTEFMSRMHGKLKPYFKNVNNQLFPLDFTPPPTEAGRSYFARRASGFFDRFMSGNTVLDVGYKGYNNPRGIKVVPHAIGVDLDYPGYDGVRLPFADESVDSVFSSHALEHVEPYQDVIRDWYRVLRLGGFIICIVPSQFLYEKKRRLPSRYNADHKRFYTPASLLQEFEESLEENSYRVRFLEENDAGFDYTRGPEIHSDGAYEIVLVVEKILKPKWILAD